MWPRSQNVRTWCPRAVYSLALTGALTGCPPEPPPPQLRKVAIAAVVLDQSTSTAVDNRCAELVARVRGYLTLPGVKRLELAVFGTGDALTGDEPMVLVKWTRFEPKHQLFEQPGARDRERTAWLAGVEGRCRSTIRPTASSPIFTAIHRAGESVKARCLDLEQGKEQCDRRFLAVHSDLRENGERSIAERLSGRAGRQALPTIDTAGLTLSVCDVANHLGVREGAPEKLLAVWKEVLGDGLVALDAACPEAGSVNLPSAAAQGGRP